MGKVHPGATLTPRFAEFLPAWLVRQPWYLGTDALAVRPVGYFRFEDPAGEVGMETHLVENDGVLYQVPMTYRAAPLPTADPRVLITTAEHSVLGTRYIYDGPADPLYLAQLLRIIDTNGVSAPSLKRGVGPAEARGVRQATRQPVSDRVRTELLRVLTPSVPPPQGPEVAGLLIGTWHPDPSSSTTVTGCLAVARTARHTD